MIMFYGYLIYLRQKNTIIYKGGLDGPSPLPEVAAPKFQAWISNNHMIMSCIPNSVFKEIVSCIVFNQTVQETQQDLHDRFHQPKYLIAPKFSNRRSC